MNEMHGLMLRFFCFCFFASIRVAMAQSDKMPATFSLAHSELFKLKTKHGIALTLAMEENNPYRLYLEQYAKVLQLIETENQVLYVQFLEKKSQDLASIEQGISPKSPYNRFLRAEIKLLWAMASIKLGHEVKAAWDVIQGYRLLAENQKLFPDFLPNQKSLGCLHILVGSVPENQKWITNVLGLNGSIQQGMKELELASKDKIWGREAIFCKTFIQAYVLNNDFNKKEDFSQLIANEDDNLNAYLLAIVISLKNHNSSLAEMYLQEMPKGSIYQSWNILDLYKGEILLFQEKYQEASVLFLSYIKSFKGKTFVKDTYYKLFLCAFLSGDAAKSRQYLLFVKKSGNEVAEADKAAQKMCLEFTQTNLFPDKNLLKLRLFFDGGRYEKCIELLKTLTEKSFNAIKDQSEFNYRSGRIFQNINQTARAILFFERAIQLGREDWYFAPASCLQLGYIYQMNGQKTKAKYYFEKAISYNKHEYKSSVDNKARAALTGMIN